MSSASSTTRTPSRRHRIAVFLVGFGFLAVAAVAGGLVGARFVHTPASAADLTPTSSATCSALCRGSGGGAIGVLGSSPLTGGGVGSGSIQAPSAP